jgi:hypothetical protein
MSSDGKSIYYFGGSKTETFVDQFDPVTNLTIRLPKELPLRVSHAGGVSSNGIAFIFNFNGAWAHVMEFTEDTESARVGADLPFEDYEVDHTVSSIVAIPAEGKDEVWLFAASTNQLKNPVLLFNVKSRTVSIPSVNTTSLPTFYEVPASVSDGRYGYIIGGMGRVQETDGSYSPRNGILR